MGVGARRATSAALCAVTFAGQVAGGSRLDFRLGLRSDIGAAEDSQCRLPIVGREWLWTLRRPVENGFHHVATIGVSIAVSYFGRLFRCCRPLGSALCGGGCTLGGVPLGGEKGRKSLTDQPQIVPAGMGKKRESRGNFPPCRRRIGRVPPGGILTAKALCGGLKPVPLKWDSSGIRLGFRNRIPVRQVIASSASVVSTQAS